MRNRHRTSHADPTAKLLHLSALVCVSVCTREREYVSGLLLASIFCGCLFTTWKLPSRISEHQDRTRRAIVCLCRASNLDSRVSRRYSDSQS